jgi:DNA polymerase-4
MSEGRKIAHVDMDAFYASVEQRDRPHLRGRPVAVGGSPEGRGVVAAASYEARRFGVRSAMSARRALALCPQLVFLPTDFARYRAVSRQLHAILEDHSDFIEPLSLDEAYLDLTDDKAGLGSATAAAMAIRQRVREELGLTCSAGVASLKFVAKIASDVRKPDGLTVVRPDQVDAFIRPLPVRRLWGVGPATARRLEAKGLHRIGDIAALSEVEALTALGPKGLYLWRMSRGIDPRRVAPRTGRKSRGMERTFPADLTDLHDLRTRLVDQVERLARAQQQAGDAPRTVTVKVRYDDFETVTRATSLPSPTLDVAQLKAAALDGLERTEAGQRPVRLLGVSLSGFDSDDTPQLRLPFEPSEGAIE